MATIGYHASHEQFGPRELLRHVQSAERAGFRAAMCSDHFYPWSERQGESGFAWSWLGAALQATRMSFGVVTVPGYRYHPAVLAQAMATLAVMFPGRFWAACGSGEALNEHITGEEWPDKNARNARLERSVAILRALFDGKHVDERGDGVHVADARLYTRPAKPPLLIGAALSPETAEWVAGWADGMVTVAHPREELEKVVRAFRRGGGEGKPMYLQAQVSYASSDGEAIEAAYDQWRFAGLEGDELAELRTPAEFDAAAQDVTREKIAKRIRASADPRRHVRWIDEDIAMGFDAIYLHDVGRDQEAFIAMCGKSLLPRFDALRV